MEVLHSPHWLGGEAFHSRWQTPAYPALQSVPREWQQPGLCALFSCSQFLVLLVAMRMSDM